jgi:large subunit ribosomal protein L35Ae
MEGRIVQFRRGLKRIHERHYILDVGADSRESASKFIGKKVAWTSSSGKKIEGSISAAHGNKGMVRAIFEKGLPGQARNEEVVVN